MTTVRGASIALAAALAASSGGCVPREVRTATFAAG